MNENELIIHIGTSKTGTTSLQQFLYVNKNNLLNQGYIYPDFLEKVPCNYYNANKYAFINGFGLYYASYDRSPYGKEIFASIMSNVQDCLRENNVILSCECFWDLDVEDFIRRVRKYCKNIRVIVYLRRQDEFLEAYWSECVRYEFTREDRTLEEYVEASEENGIARYIDKLIALNDIVRNKLTVRLYDKNELRGGDIILDFLYCLGLDEDEINWENVDRANSQLPPSVLEIKRVYNRLAKEKNWPIQYDLLFNDQVFLEQKETLPGQKIMPLALRHKIMTSHKTENEKIANLFFGGRTKPLFTEISNNSIVAEYHESTCLEKTLINLLFLSIERVKNF